MEKQLKQFIAEIREFIKHNPDEMYYNDDPVTPHEVIRIDELEDFLLEKEQRDGEKKMKIGDKVKTKFGEGKIVGELKRFGLFKFWNVEFDKPDKLGKMCHLVEQEIEKIA